jgi:hypothetical protein
MLQTLRRKGRLIAGLFSLRRSAAQRFIPHSENKVGGTANYQEHQAIPFVDRAGNADT